MKQINWLTVFFWSLIILSFGIRLAYHPNYTAFNIGGIVGVIGLICLQAFYEPKKQEE